MLHTLLPYILISLGLGATLGLFLNVKREIRLHTLKSRKRLEEMAGLLVAAGSRREVEAVYLPAAPRAGLNITKRVMAVRMLRRNQDIAHIAAALGVTRKEVELLIHVHRVTQAKSKAAASSV